MGTESVNNLENRTTPEAVTNEMHLPNADPGTAEVEAPIHDRARAAAQADESGSAVEEHK